MLLVLLYYTEFVKEEGGEEPQLERERGERESKFRGVRKMWESQGRRKVSKTQGMDEGNRPSHEIFRFLVLLYYYGNV